MLPSSYASLPMGEFKSAIVAKDESVKDEFRIYMSPYTELHEDICEMFHLRDTRLENLVRVEFSPLSMDRAHLIDEYTFKIDADRTPSWFIAEIQEKVSTRLRDYVKSTIVTEKVVMLGGGQYIIAPGATIDSIISGTIINAMCGGTVYNMFDGSIDEIFGGIVHKIHQGVVKTMRGGVVGYTCQGSIIGTIYGGTITTLGGGTVSEIFDGATIEKMFNSIILVMYGGTINTIDEDCVVRNLVGGTIGKISGNLIVRRVHKNFRGYLGSIERDATIVDDFRKKNSKNIPSTTSDSLEDFYV